MNETEVDDLWPNLPADALSLPNLRAQPNFRAVSRQAPPTAWFGLACAFVATPEA